MAGCQDVERAPLAPSAALDPPTYEVVKSQRWGLQEKSLVISLPGRTRVLSTNEGFVEADLVVNHSADPMLWMRAFEELEIDGLSGGDVYMQETETRLGAALNVDRDHIALVATAVDLDHLASATERFGPFIVTALVTAGTHSNAHRAGTDAGKNIDSAGTVNVILLVNGSFTDGAQTSAVVLATEAKTAAFQDLDVRSSYSPDAQATGTGTDTVVVIPSGRGPVVSYAGGHAKVGELIAKATYRAVREALAWELGGSQETTKLRAGEPE
ncbi:MAG: adenosylcobinamide amidohydrolase [Planctomycetota bacterium]